MSDSDFIRNVNSVQNGAFSTPEIAEITDLRAKLQDADAALRWLSMELGNPAVEGETLEMALVQEAASRILRAESRAEAAEAECDGLKATLQDFEADQAAEDRIDELMEQNTRLQAEVARLRQAVEGERRMKKVYRDRIAELEEAIKRLLSHADDEYYGQAAAEAKALLGEKP